MFGVKDIKSPQGEPIGSTNPVRRATSFPLCQLARFEGEDVGSTKSGRAQRVLGPHGIELDASKVGRFKNVVFHVNGLQLLGVCQRRQMRHFCDALRTRA